MNMNEPTKHRSDAQDPNHHIANWEVDVVTSSPCVSYKKKTQMLMFIITNRMTLLSFGLAPAEIGTRNTVSPSRPVMNKS